MKRYRIGFAVLGVISVPAVAAACWPMWGRPAYRPAYSAPMYAVPVTPRPCMDTPRRFTARRCATRCRTPSAHPFGGPRCPRLCFRLRALRPSPRQQCPHRHRERGVRFPHQCRPLLFPCVPAGPGVGPAGRRLGCGAQGRRAFTSRAQSHDTPGREYQAAGTGLSEDRDSPESATRSEDSAARTVKATGPGFGPQSARGSARPRTCSSPRSHPPRRVEGPSR